MDSKKTSSDNVTIQEIEILLEELCKTNFPDLYTETFSSNLQNISSFQELVQYIILLIKLERKYQNYLKKDLNEYYIVLIQQIQKKFISLESTMTQNFFLLRDTIYLYEIISKIENIPNNINLEQFIIKIKNFYNGTKYTSDMQIYISEVLLLADILNQDENYLKEYLKRVITFFLHDVNKYNYHEFIKAVLTKLDITLSFILELLIEIFEKDYFNLTFLQRRSIFNWSLHVLNNISQYHNNSQWLVLYPILKKILFQHLENNQINEAMYVEFFTWHIISNLHQTPEEAKKFNDEITLPASKYYQQYDDQNNLIKAKKDIRKNGKIRIALVKDRIDNTAPTYVDLAVLKVLKASKEFTENYEINIYSCNYYEKSQDNPSTIKMYEDMGVSIINPNQGMYKEYGYYVDHLQKAINLRESIIKDDNDIMIVATNNYPIVNFLLVNRTAPKQIFWSHGNFSYNLPGIDKRMAHCSGEISKEVLFGFTYYKFNIKYNKEDINPNISKQSIKETRQLFPKDMIILGTIGRLVKIDNLEYLKTIISVMQQNKNTIYLAAGDGNKNKILEKMNKIDPSIIERFYFVGKVDAALYGNIIDIVPDTFPLPQGNSRIELALKGKPLIKKLEKSMENKPIPDLYRPYANVFYEFLNIENFRVTTNEKYSLVLDTLIKNEKFRKALGDTYRKGYEKVYIKNNKTPYIKDFLQCL